MAKEYKIPEPRILRVEEAQAIYQSTQRRAQWARAGVTTDFVADLMKQLNLNNKETAHLIDISTKTLERHFQAHRPFKGLQSDRLVELANLYLLGMEVFHDQEKFLKWLDSKLPALGNTSPREWLDTQQGIDLVADEIGRIKHGIFS